MEFIIRPEPQDINTIDVQSTTFSSDVLSPLNEDKISVKRATSLTVLPIPPSESKVEDIDIIPSPDVAPTVSFSANKAARLAGVLSEPSVSVPMPNGLKPAEIPTATPVEDPPGLFPNIVSFKHRARLGIDNSTLSPSL
jgi:hypothetical protein